MRGKTLTDFVIRIRRQRPPLINCKVFQLQLIGTAL